MNFDFRSFVAVLSLPSITLLGCVTAYVYSEQKGIKSSLKFLSKFFPRRSQTFYFRVDFVISALIGTSIGIILYSPTTGYQSACRRHWLDCGIQHPEVRGP